MTPPRTTYRLTLTAEPGHERRVPPVLYYRSRTPLTDHYTAEHGATVYNLLRAAGYAQGWTCITVQGAEVTLDIPAGPPGRIEIIARGTIEVVPGA